MPGRILYIIPSSFTIQHQLRGHFAYLKSKGFEIAIVSEGDQRSLNSAKREGVAIFPANISSTRTKIEDIKALIFLMKLIKNDKYQIINCCTKKGGLLGVMAAKLTDTKAVYVIHGIKLHEGGIKSLAARWLEKVTCSMADKVIFLRQSNMELYEWICPPAKMKIIARGSINGVDAEHFRLGSEIQKEALLFREKMGIGSKDYVFGFVGRLVPEKGIRELYNMWKRIRQKYTNIFLLLVSPPEVDKQIEEIVRDLREDPRVHFTGFLEDPRVAYGAMNCLLLPTYAEGFGTVILEAGAMEIPVIASRTLGCVDAVIDGVTGILVAPRDVDDLTRAAEFIMANPLKGKEWGKNGRKNCELYFRPADVWEGYMELYEEMIAGKK